MVVNQDRKSSLCVILYEGLGSQPANEETRSHIVHAALNCGCKILVSRDPAILANDSPKPFLAVGYFSSEFLAANEPATGDSSVCYETLENRDGTQITQIIETNSECFPINRMVTWKPWFPVIDYGRCDNCLQCLSFCLFDVYGRSDEGKIKVINPSKCKTDCPACSRVCPQTAIIFPKYASGPINGDDVNEGDRSRGKTKIDLSSLLGGDIYQTLRDRNSRSVSRFSSERDETKALMERKRCLRELQDKLGIPDELLASLSGMEIQQDKSKPS